MNPHIEKCREIAIGLHENMMRLYAIKNSLAHDYQKVDEIISIQAHRLAELGEELKILDTYGLNQETKRGEA